MTILDGQQGGSVVTVAGRATGLSTIDGFTIRNGNGNLSRLIDTAAGSTATRRSPTIANNTITGNSAHPTAAGSTAPVPPRRSRTTRSRATRASATAAGSTAHSSSPTIANNTITGNSAGYGGGIYCDSSSPTIANTIVAFNSSGIYKTGIGHADPAVQLRVRQRGLQLLRRDRSHGDQRQHLGRPEAGRTLPTATCTSSRTRRAWMPGMTRWFRRAGWTSTARRGSSGQHVDIGADESDGTVWPAGPYVIVRVSPEGDDANDGSSWALAKRTVQAGIDAAVGAGRRGLGPGRDLP